MAGAGYKSFGTGTVLTANDVQTYLMDQAVMNFAGTAARGSALPSPSTGMVTHVGGGTVQVWNGSSWQTVGGAAVPAAVISATPIGTMTVGSDQFACHRWVSNGSVVVTTAGTVDALIAGGGGGGGVSGNGAGGGAGAGAMTMQTYYLPAGTHTITVGAGGASTSIGNVSSLGTLVNVIGGGAGGGNAGSASG